MSDHAKTPGEARLNQEPQPPDTPKGSGGGEGLRRALQEITEVEHTRAVCRCEGPHDPDQCMYPSISLDGMEKCQAIALTALQSIEQENHDQAEADPALESLAEEALDPGPATPNPEGGQETDIEGASPGSWDRDEAPGVGGGDE